MDLSIIIVNYNVYDDVKNCIESIYKHIKNIIFEIIVVDNNSSDKSIYEISNLYSKITFIALESNKGFGYANNIGMRKAKGKYLLLVNPDIVFHDNSVGIMYDFIEKNDTVGVVGPIQYKPKTGLEYYYTFFPTLYSRLMQENRLYMKASIMKSRFFDFIDQNISAGIPFKVDWVIGSCLMVRKKIFDDIGGFDEAFFLFEEETEWQYRMNRRGWVTYMVPAAKVLHNHHSSVSKIGKIFVYYQEFRSRIIFDRKRFKGIKYLLRVVLIEMGLGLRVIFFLLRSIFNKSLYIKFKAYYDLL